MAAQRVKGERGAAGIQVRRALPDDNDRAEQFQRLQMRQRMHLVGVRLTSSRCGRSLLFHGVAV